MLKEATDLVNQDALHQLVLVAVDSAVTATLMTPGFTYQLDLAVAVTLATPALSRHLDAALPATLMAQVTQYIDLAATCEVDNQITQKLDDIFKSFNDGVLTQQKEVTDSLQATQLSVEKFAVTFAQDNSFLAVNAHI